MSHFWISAAAESHNRDFLNQFGLLAGEGCENFGGGATSEAGDGGMALVGVTFIWNVSSHFDERFATAQSSEVSKCNRGVESNSG